MCGAISNYTSIHITFVSTVCARLRLSVSNYEFTVVRISDWIGGLCVSVSNSECLLMDGYMYTKSSF